MTPDLSHFETFRQFAAAFERQGLGSEQSLRWLCRFRHGNGLIASGAVVEVRTPGATRPRLLINIPRFAAWLAGPERQSGSGQGAEGR